jgi:hypothetical protein
MIDPKRISTACRIILGKESHDSLKGPKRALKLLLRRSRASTSAFP